MKKLLVVTFILFAAHRAQAQSLDRLKERAAAYWAERLAGNQQGFLKFVEPASIDSVRRDQQVRVLSAEVSGIEFGNQPNSATVVTKVRLAMLEFGETNRDFRDLWVWNGKNWFLRPDKAGLVETLTNPNARVASSTRLPPLRFEPSPNRIELGKRVQGAILSAQLSFKTDRDRISVILPGDLPGVTFGPVEWRDKETGTISLSVDTALMSEDIVKPLIFRIIEVDGKETLKPIPFLLQMEGRIR